MLTCEDDTLLISQSVQASYYNCSLLFEMGEQKMYKTHTHHRFRFANPVVLTLDIE